MLEIGRLAVVLKLDTNHDWHSHAAANRTFRQGVASLLALFGQPSGPTEFAPDELPPQRLVDSIDPETIGIGLAAIVFHNRPLTEDERRQVHERDAEFRRLREQFKAGGEFGPVSSLFQDKPKGGKS